MVAVSLKNVSVQIPIYGAGTTSIRSALLDKAVGGRFGKAGSHLIVTALKDISFEAKDGDRIGLVGRNGSGKSTLLRVLSDVYPPTSGTVEVTGSVSPMFDASLGMDLDATGMENIRISGRLWGLTPEQIKENTPNIIEFTELGDFLNVPVRTYSKGMAMRLAFAIATVREPDILLIDEVIGAGDPNFFKKAFERIKGVISKSRVLFVASHSDAHSHATLQQDHLAGSRNVGPGGRPGNGSRRLSGQGLWMFRTTSSRRWRSCKLSKRCCA